MHDLETSLDDKSRHEMSKDKAAALSRKGWKFIEMKGPRGIYFEGRGPHGARVMGEQNPDRAIALLAAINHAFTVQFPAP